MSAGFHLLNKLKVGLGAVKLDKSVKKVYLKFPTKKADASGARYFYEQYVPRIAFNNPDLVFEISRPQEKTVPQLKVEFDDGKQKSIEIERMWSDDICYQFLEITLNKKMDQTKEEQQ